MMTDPLAALEAEGIAARAAELLQVRSGVEALVACGATRVGECGPGKVLTGLVKRIDKALDARAIGGVGDFEVTIKEWK